MNPFKFACSSVILSVALSAGFVKAKEDDVHDLNPRHGGIVSESNHMEFELVLNSKASELYVRDHGKPVDLSQAKGKLIVLNAGKKNEIQLVGSTALLKGSAIELGAGTYTAVATIDLANKKTVTVRFKSK